MIAAEPELSHIREFMIFCDLAWRQMAVVIVDWLRLCVAVIKFTRLFRGQKKILVNERSAGHRRNRMRRKIWVEKLFRDVAQHFSERRITNEELAGARANRRRREARVFREEDDVARDVLGKVQAAFIADRVET